MERSGDDANEKNELIRELLPVRDKDPYREYLIYLNVLLFQLKLALIYLFPSLLSAKMLIFYKIYILSSR